mgnify:CR=1 FL=1
MERFKSNYTDWYILSGILLTMGGTVSYAIFLFGLMELAVFLLLFFLAICFYWWKQVYEYNKDLDNKAHLYVDSPILNDHQKKFFVFGFREDLNSTKRRLFYIRDKASKVFFHFEHKIQNNIPLSEQEQYILNLFLIGALDLSMIYFRFQDFFQN